MEKNVVVIHPDDNVAVALREIKSGETLSGAEGKVVTATADVPRSHKVAIENIPDGGPILKYGEIVGQAKGNIAAGDWVHTHNIRAEE